jgi:hypothetical protein
MKKVGLTLLICVFLKTSMFSQSYKVKEDNVNLVTEIINTIFNQNKVYLYKHFIDFKGIHSFLSNPKLLDELYGNCIQGDKRITFEDYISKNKEGFIKEIEKEYVSLGKLKGKLRKNIKLVKAYSREKNQNLIRISAPIIVNNIGMLYLQTKGEEQILVLERKGNIWKTVCIKYLFVAIDN